MTAISIIGGLLIMGIGAFYLFLPGAAWTMQKWENSFEGQRSERSGMWEFGRILRGLILLIGGLVFMAWGLSLD